MSNFKLKSPQKASNLHAYWGAVAPDVDLPSLASDEQFTAQSGVLEHSFSFPATFDYANIGSSIETQIKTAANNEILAESTTPTEKRLIDVANTPINRSESEYLAALYRITSGSSLGFLLEDEGYPGAIARFDGEVSFSTSACKEADSFQLDRCVVKVTGSDDLTTSRTWSSATPFPSSGGFLVSCVYSPKDDDIDLSAIASVVQYPGGAYCVLMSTDSEFLADSDLFYAAGSPTAICQVKDKLYVGFSRGTGDIIEYSPNASLNKIAKIHPSTTDKLHWQFVNFKNILVSASQDATHNGTISYYTGKWKHSFISSTFEARCAAVDGDWLYCGGRENNESKLYRTKDLFHWQQVLVGSGTNVVGLYCDRNQFYVFIHLDTTSVAVFSFDGKSLTSLGSVGLSATNSTITATKFRGAIYFGATRTSVLSHNNPTDLFRIQKNTLYQAVPEVMAIGGGIANGINSLLVYRDSLFVVDLVLQGLTCSVVTKDVITAFSHLLSIPGDGAEPPFRGGQCEGARYAVTVRVTQTTGQLVGTYTQTVWGKIFGVGTIRGSAGNVGGNYTSVVFCRGSASQAYSDLAIKTEGFVGTNEPITTTLVSLTRTDGFPDSCGDLETEKTFKLYFTDFDRNLRIGENVYKSQKGLSLSAFDVSIDLNVDSSEAKLFTTDDVNEIWCLSNLKKGLFVNADCFIDVLNRRSFDASFRNRIFTGQIGEIKIDDLEVTLELRSYLQKLQQKSIKKTSSLCPYLFGDSKCRKDLTGLEITVSVTEPLSLTQFKIPTTLLTLKDGEVEFLSGDNQQTIATVQSYENDIVTLWQPLPFLAASGDSIRLTAGCDKTIQTCGQTYSNQLNFGGFPWVMGKDQYMAGANRSVSV